jgi:hypothetical protein
MNYIQGISFPRSGHHMLIRRLTKYYSTVSGADVCIKDKSRKNSETAIDNNSFVYCELYNTCQTIPCIDKRCNFQKNHDFLLDLPIKKELHHLVQIRNPIDAITSLFELSLRMGWNNLKDTQECWVSFFDNQLLTYQKFYTKWVAQQKNNIEIFWYDAFLENPAPHLVRAIELLDNQDSIDMELVEKLCGNISLRSSHKKFRYYSLLMEEKVYKSNIEINKNSFLNKS